VISFRITPGARTNSVRYEIEGERFSDLALAARFDHLLAEARARGLGITITHSRTGEIIDLATNPSGALRRIGCN